MQKIGPADRGVRQEDMRTIKIDGKGIDPGRIEVLERDDGALVIASGSFTERGLAIKASAMLDATQLLALVRELAGWFGAIVLTTDQQHACSDGLHDRIVAVMEQNESRCLDDEIDRGVVVRELVKALDPRFRA
jgi:hypothetical protein